MPDRAYYSRNFGNVEELKYGNVQNVCNFGAELENLPPLTQASWVMCGFQVGLLEGCILSAMTKTKPY